MIETILLASLASMGFYIAGEYPFVLHDLKAWIAKALGGSMHIELHREGEERYFVFPSAVISWLWRPFWGCPTCMASVWGIMSYMAFMGFSWASIYELPFVVLGTACINFTLTNKVLDL